MNNRGVVDNGVKCLDMRGKFLQFLVLIEKGTGGDVFGDFVYIHAYFSEVLFTLANLGEVNTVHFAEPIWDGFRNANIEKVCSISIGDVE